MNFMRYLLAMVCPVGLLQLSFDGGGIGNSGPSTTEQNTETNDVRIAGGNGSINTSSKYDISGDITGANASISFTDHGAVAGALKFAGETSHDGYALALRGIEQANAITAQTVAANGSLLTGALKMAGDQNEQSIETLKDLKSADVRTLAIVGAVVVGITAVTIFHRKG